MTKVVLHLIQSDGVYGAEQVILNLSRQMKNDTNYSALIGCIVSSPDEQNDLFDEAKSRGLEAIKLTISNSGFLFQLPYVARQLKALSVSLIHSHGYKPTVFGWSLSKLLSLPMTATCHLWFKPESGPLKMRLMIAIEKRLYPYFPVVVAVSDEIKAKLIGFGVDAGKVRVIKNGVQIQSIEKGVSSEIRKSSGLNGGEFLVTNVARLTEQKAQHILIDAIAMLRRKGFDIAALIVGEGPLKQELDAQVRNLDIADHVKLLGFQKNIREILASSDVFALPSIDEGMPISLLEAISADVPVVATDVGDIGKLVRHGQSGLIVPVGDIDALASGIMELMEDKEKAREYSKSALAKLRAQYSCEAMASQYNEVYDLIFLGGRD
ncbi:MAG: glycosyltransferase [Oleiphilaceae bacterium]|nr:glycosyltransferase [Oleiphilaceae bacterium]